MSDRHMHITSFLGGYEAPEAIERFVQAARALPDAFFWQVIPVINDHGNTIAVALYSKDGDGLSNETEMPAVAEALSGIFERDIEIVSAWEGGDPAPSPWRPSPRERVWLVRGTSSRETIPGEVVQRQIGA